MLVDAALIPARRGGFSTESMTLLQTVQWFVTNGVEMLVSVSCGTNRVDTVLYDTIQYYMILSCTFVYSIVALCLPLLDTTGGFRLLASCRPSGHQLCSETRQ